MKSRLTVALLLSVLLHLAMVGAPGWLLPHDDSGEELRPLAANLPAMLRPSPAAPRPAARPKPAVPRPPVPAAAPGPDAAVTPLPGGEAAAPPQAATAADAPAAPAVPEAAPAAPVATAPLEAAADIALPPSGRIRYSISRGEKGFVVGQAIHEWHHDGLAYTIRSVSETTGLVALFRSARVIQNSEGSLSPAGLVPHEFRIERNGVAETASFDWKGGRVTLSAGGTCTPASMAGTQDILSLFYQFGLLANRPAAAEVSVVTGRKCERYAFEWLGEERLSLAFGEQRVLHLRSGGAAGGEATEVWIGLDLAGLPLKIRHVDRKGDSFDQVAQQIEINNDKGKN